MRRLRIALLVLAAPALGQQRPPATLVPLPVEVKPRVIPPMRWKHPTPAPPLQSIAPPVLDAGTGAAGPR